MRQLELEAVSEEYSNNGRGQTLANLANWSDMLWYGNVDKTDFENS